MRGKGEGGVYRVPADKKLPLKYWTGTIELPAHDGKRRKATVRRKDKAALLEELDKLRTQLKKQGDLPTKNQTVKQWFEYWYREIAAKSVRPNTLEGYRSVVFLHIIPTIGNVKLNKVTPAHVRRVTDGMIDGGLSSTYALLAHRTMAVSFKIAVREGRMSQNPAALTDAPLKAIAPQEAFDVPEAIRVLHHVAGDPVLGARWATALLTGARRGEVIGIERDRVVMEIDDNGEEYWQLDLSWQLQRLALTEETGKPNVPANFEYRHLTGGLYLTRPKSKTSQRMIPLVDPLKWIILRHMANTEPNAYGLLFAPNGEPIDPDQDSARWKVVLAETGIQKDVVLHGLRHTAVDLLFYAGVPEDIISEIVGHSDRATTRKYKTRGNVNRVRLNTAMAQFSALFSSPTGEFEETRQLNAG
jgi:integrase